MPVKEKLNVVGSGVHSAPFIVHIARLFVITSRHPKRRRPRWLDGNSASLFSLARCRQLGCREQISKLVCKQEERSRQETLRKRIKKERKERKKEQQQKCFRSAGSIFSPFLSSMLRKLLFFHRVKHFNLDFLSQFLR